MEPQSVPTLLYPLMSPQHGHPPELQLEGILWDTVRMQQPQRNGNSTLGNSEQPVLHLKHPGTFKFLFHASP